MLPLAGFWMALFWAAVVVLVLAGFARVRARLGQRLGRGELGDEDIRAIEETGVLRVDVDEPLDLEEIEEEERRFWDEEGWDRADEW